MTVTKVTNNDNDITTLIIVFFKKNLSDDKIYLCVIIIY